MQPDLERVIQYITDNRGTCKFTMGTKQESILYSPGAVINKKKTETVTKLRTYESHRVSQGILHGILNKVDREIVRPPPSIIRIKKEKVNTCGQKEIPMKKPTSMSTLILWNISKALEINPYMDLKSAISAASAQLDNHPRDVNAVISEFPEQQHLVCALLAWQQLGHNDADSLYKFIEAKRKEVDNASTASSMKIIDPISKDKSPPRTLNTSTGTHCCTRDPNISKCIDSGSFGSHSSGPVVKLPVETKVIMRCENQGSRQMTVRVHREQDKDTMNKIDAACCLESACVERLATLDATTKELRTRASKLARREAERVELLERAEAAWKDLEIGYQRRLALAEEKEEDINKQIQKLIADRNVYKNACTALALQLKERGDAADKERAKLTEVEKLVCDRACIKLRLSEEAAKGEAILAEHQCKAAQLDRDLQFKEEQARRKLMSLDNEADSARALTHEAERAMRSELSGLREQIAQVSNELLEEDELNVRIKAEHDQLRQEKDEIVEDLEGCKVMCDLRMQGRLDELQKKKDLLNGFKDQVMDCRCKMPVDVMVEAKRTPSLAALCRCAPEDRLLESCSCTSLRGRLLSNLLADLFGGLQTELSGSGSQMPCQLLKCLEDKHNWDRASVVKTNLRNFFSKLLMGELDIAIATAIENYHAKWVGASCADASKMIPEPEDDLNEGWQQRALERRAQKLATQLAEQLFQERAEQVAQRARDIVTSGPPPCECKPPTAEAAVYPCLMQSNVPFGGGTTIVNQQTSETPAFWKRTIQDVTQLRLQIEDLQKESIKKEDLKIMEQKIAKIVKQASATENEDSPTNTKDISNLHGENTKRETKTLRTANTDEYPKTTNQTKTGVTRRKLIDNNSVFKKPSLNDKPTRQGRKLGHGQSYAVNLCLCGPQKNSKNGQFNNEGKSSWKQKPSRDIIPQNSSVKQTKPINISLPNPDIDEHDSKTSAQPSCNSDCKCFHKVPSNTSIDKLLETLAKWKCDLADPQEKCIKNIKSSLSKYSKSAIKDSMRVNDQNDSKINLSISTVSNKEQINVTDNSDRKLQKEIDVDTRFAHLTQPAITVSEYMGAVNLDKSNENICKCINKFDSEKENNQEKNNNGNNDIQFKCIHSNACECRIYQNMQKDNKTLQTEDLNKVEISNQFQTIQTEDTPVIKNSIITNSIHVNNQKVLERTSDINNVAQNTELFPSNCDYYIKFLGVTLDDINPHMKTKKVIKKNGKTEDLLVSRDKYIERQKKRPKKLSNMEPSSSFNKANVITIEENCHSGSFDKPSKCECNAKLEEFKMFMNNIFTKQLQHAYTHKDECLDSQSFKYTENSLESCVCCNSFTGDDSKDLEVNAFHLLEDHLKGKLEEFKSFSCKSSCIPPEEEEKLFSAILKRVKQVISDCANEMKCTCPGSLQSDGSWNRAYGLLQEYLKIKIKRVQCLCVIKDNKDVILPDILEKVCTLIENDFQRLKDICKCRNDNDINKKPVHIEDLILPVKEVPEKDTNTSHTKYDIVEVQTFPVPKKISKQNSNRSMILMENISSQVPPNLGMEAKSCEVLQLGQNNARTTETDTIITESKSNGVMYNKCDCCYNTEKKGSGHFYNMFATKEVLVNLYTDAMKNTNDICEVPKNVIAHGSLSHLSVDRFDSLKTLLDKNMNENIKSKNEEQVVSEQNTHLPDNSMDCTCGRPLGSGVCMKSIVRPKNDKIENIWKEYLANNCNKDFSYIMHGSRNKDHDAINDYHTTLGGIVVDVIPESNEQIDNKSMCETEVNAQNEDEMVLKNSQNNIDTIHNTTNTFEENFSLGISCSNSESPLDWFECPVPINSDVGSNAVNLTNSIYFPMPTGSSTLTDTDTIKTHQNCECDMVPICHVKMLVENIEKNLIESKCTCDSLISKVCPVHSKK